jgi:hypothetical protein
MNAQLKLGKSIGLDHLPSDHDTLQRTLNVVQDGNEPGPKQGSLINHFKLYGLNNDSLDISTELSKGKPVLLINASYSCPFFRRSLHFFDSIAENNKNISCFIIYTIEGHPDYPYICPYTNEEWELKQNINEGVFIKQPRNYGERKQAASTMISRTSIKIPVFIDGLKNEWLNSFGTIPALAYVISPKGKVRFKYMNYKIQKKEICRDINLITK